MLPLVKLVLRRFGYTVLPSIEWENAKQALPAYSPAGPLADLKSERDLLATQIERCKIVEHALERRISELEREAVFLQRTIESNDTSGAYRSLRDELFVAKRREGDINKLLEYVQRQKS